MEQAQNRPWSELVIEAQCHIDQDHEQAIEYCKQTVTLQLRTYLRSNSINATDVWI
ncbi:hypothetical protein D3C87_2187610 [compost metagenome]